MEHHSLPVEWNQEPLTKLELEKICEDYDCDGYITSIVDDTQRDLYDHLNPIMSNRFYNMGREHFKKCQFLYENAKVVYSDLMSTFDIVAESHGIKVIGRGNQNMPRDYDNIEVLTDGQSCARILKVIKEILDGFS